MMDSDESRKEAQRQIAELEKKMAALVCQRNGFLALLNMTWGGHVLTCLGLDKI